MRIPLLKKKVTLPPTLAERAEEASLDGANALSVFEAAAYKLDEAAANLAGLALEATEAAVNVTDQAHEEIAAITRRAAWDEAELNALAARLEDEAFEDRQRAENIRTMVLTG